MILAPLFDPLLCGSTMEIFDAFGHCLRVGV